MVENTNISDLPNGVKIISIGGIIFSIISSSIGIYLITYSFIGIETKAFLGMLFGQFFLVPSIFQLIFCIFTLKRKNWARIALGIFALIGGGALILFMQFALLTFMVSISNENQQNQVLDLYRSIQLIARFIIFGLMIFIFWYLLFDKKVKKAFS